MNKKSKSRSYPEDWQLLEAASGILLSNRLKVLWEYVIMGKKPTFTVEAWIHRRRKVVGELKLFVHYGRIG